MDAKALAKDLDGMEYGSDIDLGLINRATDNRLVIVMGASDDLVEFWGKIYDEASCYNGGKIYLDRAGIIGIPSCDCEWAEQWYKDKCENGTLIEAVWCENADASWTYKTKLLHETFKVMEDGEVYCVGIVFNYLDL